ncbi:MULTISPECIES: nucleotidyltransferase domain-containing protein [Persicobacter]|uniref:Polymerase beta nucleotidyltransferase domain-containing protein n=1 Tax=Persicobacter diffluens TaxID=981 RepID=A0AAN5AM27_9BACT|nr:nucleotidyltransferase domain-containing protein [Persicobacter sp. CCB-QB2]GJM61991.1 hypothetical protein PEDI_25430 [Persicobacter diffluens]
MKSSGLRDTDLACIFKAATGFPEIERILLFGSRALGTHRKWSDVDLAIFGSAVDLDVVANFKFQLEEELPLPYFFDVVNYQKLNNPALKEHIDQYGKEIYNKREAGF